MAMMEILFDFRWWVLPAIAGLMLAIWITGNVIISYRVRLIIEWEVLGAYWLLLMLVMSAALMGVYGVLCAVF